ncbi:MAG: COX15/CtaA family protein [Acidobacteriota bacterium]
MTSHSRADARPQVSIEPTARRRFVRYTWGVLGYNLFVVLWGAFVRATGSGAGCGSHWPLCNGEVVPRAPSVETLIEYSHRVTSGVALLMVVALPILARRTFPAGHIVRRTAWVALILMLMEAGIGAGLVLFELVADNASTARGLFMATHLANTFLLLGAITCVGHFASGAPAPRRPFDPRITRWAMASLVGMLLVGVSGAIAALGDTLYPVESLMDGLRADLDPASSMLVRLRVLHPGLAIGVGLVLLAFVAIVRRSAADADSRRFANAVNLLVLTQLTAGAINVLLLAPVWMQLLHLLLADLLWISLVRMVPAALVASEGIARTSSTAPLETSLAEARR